MPDGNTLSKVDEADEQGFDQEVSLVIIAGAIFLALFFGVPPLLGWVLNFCYACS